MPKFGSVQDGKIWAGADYGYQSPASFNKLQEAGELRVGSSIMRRLGQAFNQVLDALPQGRAYANAVGQAMAEDAAARKKPLELIGMDPTKPTATDKAIDFLSEKSNINKTLLGTGIGLAQGAIEARLGVGSVKLLKNKPRSVGAQGASRRREMPEVFLSDDAVREQAVAARNLEFRSKGVNPYLSTEHYPYKKWEPALKEAGVAGGPVPRGQDARTADAIIKARQNIDNIGEASRAAKEVMLPPGLQGDVAREAFGPIKGLDPRRNTLDMLADAKSHLIVQAPGGNNARTGTPGRASAARSSKVIQDIIDSYPKGKRRRAVFDELESRSANPRTEMPPSAVERAKQDTAKGWRNPKTQGSETPMTGLALTKKQREELRRAKDAAQEAAIDELQEQVEEYLEGQGSRAEDYGFELGLPPVGSRKPGRYTPPSRGDGTKPASNSSASRSIQSRISASEKPQTQGPRLPPGAGRRRPAGKPYRGADKPTQGGTTERFTQQELVGKSTSYQNASREFDSSGEVIGKGYKKGQRVYPGARSEKAIKQTEATLQGRLKRLLAMRENATGRQASSLDTRIDALTELLNQLKFEGR